MSAKYIAAIDQGTTSTRFMIFDHESRPVSSAQKEHTQHFPQPGWVEHDALEIWQNTTEVVTEALANAGLRTADLAGVGITNQRETTVLWDRTTGKPVAPAIVWQDTRTASIVSELEARFGTDWFRGRTGLPLATYFSGPKLAWLLQSDPELRSRAEEGALAFGTIDSWLIWNLTGGPRGGKHLSDVTNASRTLLMNLKSLSWDDELLVALDIPRKILPEIVPSSAVFGIATGPLDGVPIAGAIGDQQAALFGQTCFESGESKSTYGTGAFLLLNTGDSPIESKNGLVSSVAYQLEGGAAKYCLEGSIAVSGSLVQWFRDQLGAIESAPEIEALAASVADNGGCYFVPAFSGLFAPHWRTDARGVIAGLTGYVTKSHIARAILEASAWQTRELIDAMAADTGISSTTLRVDGGMTANELFLQILADVLGVEVVRSEILETTSLGAAYAAGLAVGFWPDLETLKSGRRAGAHIAPKLGTIERENEYSNWKKAVERTLNWLD